MKLPALFKLLHPAAIPPFRGSEQAAGLDICTIQPVEIPPGKRALLRTGLAMAIPAGTVGLIWPRSKLAAGYGLDRLAGVVDSDYRGEVMISLINHGEDTIELKKGDRCAQMLIMPVYLPEVHIVDELDDTDRGAAGINSTDLRLRA